MQVLNFLLTLDSKCFDLVDWVVLWFWLLPLQLMVVVDHHSTVSIVCDTFLILIWVPLCFWFMSMTQQILFHHHWHFTEWTLYRMVNSEVDTFHLHCTYHNSTNGGFNPTVDTYWTVPASSFCNFYQPTSTHSLL